MEESVVYFLRFCRLGGGWNDTHINNSCFSSFHRILYDFSLRLTFSDLNRSISGRKCCISPHYSQFGGGWNDTHLNYSFFIVLSNSFLFSLCLTFNYLSRSISERKCRIFFHITVKLVVGE